MFYIFVEEIYGLQLILQQFVTNYNVPHVSVGSKETIFLIQMLHSFIIGQMIET